jgi:hypothetical protein
MYRTAFLRRPSANTLFKSISYISRDIDSRAPTNLTEDEKDSLKTYSLIVELRDCRDAISAEARRIYSTLKNTEENDLKVYTFYREAQSQFERAKKSLIREKRQKTWA